MSLTVIILARDEVLHIARAIASVRDIAARVVVVDSGSTDGTPEIAAAAGADVLHNAWVNHAVQFNWALDNAELATEWIMRLDADEIVLPELAARLPAALAAAGDAVGFTINRRIVFLGRWLRWGGLYPVRTARIFRTGRGRVELKRMDEHILIDGRVAHFDGDIADINLNSLGWWTAKHNHYATLLAIEALAPAPPAAGLARQARIKRGVMRIYARLPLGARAAAYFLYRYLLRLGLLDGWQGLVFHVLQGGWYRFLVDAKIAELRAAMREQSLTLPDAVRDRYGIEV